MTRRIGWYVHHHGRGHLTRLLAVAPFVDAAVDCFSSLPEPEDLPPNCRWFLLPRDDDSVGGRDPAASAPTAGGVVHWAPLGHPGHRERLTMIAARLVESPVDAFVVDVSVEVAVFARLLGVPVLLMTQPGVRDDAPHRLAFDVASVILAPWPGELLRPAHLEPFSAKTVFTGGISRFSGRTRPERRGEDVIVLGGAGGSTTTDADVVRAQEATDKRWRRLGGAAWSTDPWDDIAGAPIVVSEAGQNAVADLAAADARAVVVPQARPFDEQQATARALERAGLAVVIPRWGSGDEWPDVLARAESLDPDWSRWQVTGAAERAAAAILGVTAA